MRIIVMLRILQCEGHIEITADVLDAEWSKTLIWQGTSMRQLRVSERTHQVKVCIELLDGSEAEIGGIDKVTASALAKSESFVNCTHESPLTHGWAIHPKDAMGQVNVKIPSWYGAIFGSKHE